MNPKITFGPVLALLGVPALAFLIALWLTGMGWAQDRGAWFKALQDSRGRSCCDVSDCAATVAKFTNGGWEAEFNGLFVVVPKGKILETESIDGRAYLCALPGDKGPVIYCFVKPGGGF